MQTQKHIGREAENIPEFPWVCFSGLLFLLFTFSKPPCTLCTAATVFFQSNTHMTGYQTAVLFKVLYLYEDISCSFQLKIVLLPSHPTSSKSISKYHSVRICSLPLSLAEFRAPLFHELYSLSSCYCLQSKAHSQLMLVKLKSVSLFIVWK